MLKLERFIVESDCTIADYACDFTVTTAGDGLWGCEEGRKVHVTGIGVVTSAFEDEVILQVNVAHNSTWDIYTDSGFENAISEVLGLRVQFTEQGMQEDNFASMEV
jgi:hypothetical protein